MDVETKQNLLQQFQTYLDDLPEKGSEQGTGSESKDASADLYSIFSELTALKSEVRSEARLMKTAFDEFKAAFSLVEQTNGMLHDDLDECRRQKSEVRQQTLRPILLALCDLYDRLAAGISCFTSYHPSLFSSFCPREKKMIAATAQGQQMSLERLQQVLSEFQVEPIMAVGKPFDPSSMRAIEADENGQYGDGVVTGELRKGFIWNERVLRLAEVRVNKSVNIRQHLP